jgi:hypothetical protein
MVAVSFIGRGNREKTIKLLQVTNKHYHLMLYHTKMLNKTTIIKQECLGNNNDKKNLNKILCKLKTI